MATEQPEEQVNILARDGAISILRDIRLDIRTTDLTGFYLASEPAQIIILRRLLDQTRAQLYAMSVMLSGVLGDPMVQVELSSELSETIDKLEAEGRGDEVPE